MLLRYRYLVGTVPVDICSEVQFQPAGSCDNNLLPPLCEEGGTARHHSLFFVTEQNIKGQTPVHFCRTSKRSVSYHIRFLYINGNIISLTRVSPYLLVPPHLRSLIFDFFQRLGPFPPFVYLVCFYCLAKLWTYHCVSQDLP
jgi:hypothetical protein